MKNKKIFEKETKQFIEVLKLLFRLTQSQIKQLKNEAYRSNPIEACALLFGKISKTACLVKKVVVATNILNSTVEFAINPQFVVAELKKAEKEG